MPMGSSERTKLRLFLINRFSLDDLKDLAFDLGIDFQQLPHQNTQELTRELIAYVVRQERTSDLITEVLKRRPDVELERLFAELLGPSSDSHSLRGFPEVEILELLRRHNHDWCKVLAANGDVRYLDATTTPRGLFQAKQDAEDEVACMHDDRIKLCRFIKLDLVKWQVMASSSFRVTVDELWEDHHRNGKKSRSTQRSIYEVVFLDGNWLIDSCETLEQIDVPDDGYAAEGA